MKFFISVLVLYSVSAFSWDGVPVVRFLDESPMVGKTKSGEKCYFIYDVKNERFSAALSTAEPNEAPAPGEHIGFNSLVSFQLESYIEKSRTLNVVMGRKGEGPLDADGKTTMIIYLASGGISVYIQNESKTFFGWKVTGKKECLFFDSEF